MAGCRTYRAYLYEGDRLIAATWHEGGTKINKMIGNNAELPIVFEIPVECEPTHVVVFDDIVVYPRHRVRLAPKDVYRIDGFHELEPKRRSWR